MNLLQALSASKPMGPGGLRQAIAWTGPKNALRSYTVAHVASTGSIVANIRLYSRTGQTFSCSIIPAVDVPEFTTWTADGLQVTP